MDAGEWLTIREAAAVMRLSRETIRRWLFSGRMKGTLLSRRGGWRVSAVEVRRVLSSGGQGGHDGR